MKKIFHTNRYVSISLLLTVSLFTGCAADTTSMHSYPTNQTKAESEAAAFDDFLDNYFREAICSNTINLHFTLTAPENYGITQTPITLGDISPQAADTARAAQENTLAALYAFDYEKLTDKQQLTYDILSDSIETALSAADLVLYEELLRPSTGVQAQLPILFEEYRFCDKQDIEDYLALIALTDDYFSQLIAFEQEKAAAGLFMSDYACDDILSQCETFIQNPDEHYLILTFNKKLGSMSNLTDAERDAYMAQNEALVKETVLPAYEKLQAALTKLLGSGTNDMGLCYFPNGKEYYEYLVYYSTGSEKTVLEIADAIKEKRSADLSQTSALAAEFPELIEQADAVRLEGMDAIGALHILKEQMLSAFPAPPDTQFTVSYIDACMEDYMAPAFYITSPIDDYTQNSIFINASTDAASMRYFTTLAHEGFPGHLYQTVMSYEAGLSPVRATLNFPGYVEGWATYVEMLSYYYAGLEEHTAALLSLQQSALLSLYASTDIGIHYDGWSFSDMLDFWYDYGIDDKTILRSVYDLIVEEPAHYLKYYVGYLEFLDLKERKQEAYGSSFDDTAFHQALLSIGPAPFAIVDKYFDAYYTNPY